MRSLFFSTLNKNQENRKAFISFTLLLLLVNLTALANGTVVIENYFYHTDHQKKLIVVNVEVSKLNSEYQGTKSAILLDEYFKFSNELLSLQVGTAYEVINTEGLVYRLYFTQLPLVKIITNEKIVDEPRVLAEFILAEPDGNIIKSHMGVEIRGGHSQSYPKNSLRIEFWEEPTPTDTLTRDFSLLGMRNDDDWNLQAFYNEPLRIRSKTANELWKLIHTPYYQKEEPDAVNGIQMEYVELIINNEYSGIYALSERVDRKQLQLKTFNGDLRGELYKGSSWGATTFTNFPDFNNNDTIWGGFEYIYPQEYIDWINLYGFVDFAVNDDDSYFYSDYQSFFEIDNAVDYFIFLNLLRAVDNTGKNIYIARYDEGEPYFYIPWDLDGVLGIDWDGRIDENTTHILSNGFYDRLICDCRKNGFHEKLNKRWNNLRTDILSHKNIMDLLEKNYLFLEHNGVYEREEISWENYQYNEQHLEYISEWLTDRLKFLDTEFNKPCEPPEGFTFDKPEPRITLYPNPASDNLTVKVEAGVVPFQIKIVNTSGYALHTEVIRSKEQPIQLPVFQPGLYFVLVQNQAFSEAQKLIIR